MITHADAKKHIMLLARFDAKIDRSGGPDTCWEWQGACTRERGGRHGYGLLAKGNRQRGNYYAHRIAWELANGPIPEGKLVLHQCDNPPCCNPRHLFLGTQSDNLRDASKKGRLQIMTCRKAAHPRTLENLTPRGACRPCQWAYWRSPAYRLRRAARRRRAA